MFYPTPRIYRNRTGIWARHPQKYIHFCGEENLNSGRLYLDFIPFIFHLSIGDIMIPRKTKERDLVHVQPLFGNLIGTGIIAGNKISHSQNKSHLHPTLSS